MSTRAQKAENATRMLPEALAQLDAQILAMVMAHGALPDILDTLCRNVEQHYSGLLCSVLLLDSDEKTLRHGAAPTLPQHYREAALAAHDWPHWR